MKHCMAVVIALILWAPLAAQAQADDKRVELERRIELLEQEVNKIRLEIASSVGTAESEYTQKATSQVRENWFFPEDLEVKQDDFLKVAVTITKDGTISKSEVVESSGNEQFNSYALESLEKSSPLEPIPDEIGKDAMELELRFRPPQE
ncbi:MAG: TonB family protein [Desulfobulbaceae bacterium]|nr:MAG: TonB family protein [Desulfobulbaceae bacterium]